MSVGTFIATYQTLITGIIGFGGVILTLLCTAKLARAQRDQELRHEQRVLKAAFCAELEYWRQILISDSKILANTKSGVLIRCRDEDTLFDKFESRVAILSEEEIGVLIRVYLSLQTLYTDFLIIDVSEPKKLEAVLQEQDKIIKFGYFSVSDPEKRAEMVDRLKRSADTIARAINQLREQTTTRPAPPVSRLHQAALGLLSSLAGGSRGTP